MAQRDEAIRIQTSMDSGSSRRVGRVKTNLLPVPLCVREMLERVMRDCARSVTTLLRSGMRKLNNGRRLLCDANYGRKLQLTNKAVVPLSR